MGVSYFGSSLATVVLVLGLVMAMGRVGESVPYGQAKKNPTGLQVGFYKGRCPNTTLDIQAFIEAEVASHFRSDATVLPAFLRLQFHDCFVKGCDASILIEGTTTEKVASANNGVREYDFIDALKVKVEAKCPGIVSCADIIAIATKVVLKLGGGPDYGVQTGRRDGTVSDANDVNLPSPSLDVPQSFEFFKAKNFTLDEMVTLLGCHTVGIAHCRHFRTRLYNDSSDYDANMDESLRQNLIQLCPQDRTVDNEVFLDQSGGIDKFDSSYYNQLALKRGLLPVDQALTRDPSTNATVNSFVANPASFNSKLALVMVKLQAVEVLTGDKGNIRKVCSKFN
ncbi:cationic peroxidase 2-like [Silene latifolia]|uniref:cationic peroxidase 2-like n=1 Tax=Silene latifolia TaxID=37657 RepID=UPI003D7838CC